MIQGCNDLSAANCIQCVFQSSLGIIPDRIRWEAQILLRKAAQEIHSQSSHIIHCSAKLCTMKLFENNISQDTVSSSVHQNTLHYVPGCTFVPVLGGLTTTYPFFNDLRRFGTLTHLDQHLICNQKHPQAHCSIKSRSGLKFRVWSWKTHESSTPAKPLLAAGSGHIYVHQIGFFPALAPPAQPECFNVQVMDQAGILLPEASFTLNVCWE